MKLHKLGILSLVLNLVLFSYGLAMENASVPPINAQTTLLVLSKSKIDLEKILQEIVPSNNFTDENMQKISIAKINYLRNLEEFKRATNEEIHDKKKEMYQNFIDKVEKSYEALPQNQKIVSEFVKLKETMEKEVDQLELTEASLRSFGNAYNKYRNKIASFTKLLGDINRDLADLIRSIDQVRGEIVDYKRQLVLSGKKNKGIVQDKIDKLNEEMQQLEKEIEIISRQKEFLEKLFNYANTSVNYIKTMDNLKSFILKTLQILEENKEMREDVIDLRKAYLRFLESKVEIYEAIYKSQNIKKMIMANKNYEDSINKMGTFIDQYQEKSVFVKTLRDADLIIKFLEEAANLNLEQNSVIDNSSAGIQYAQQILESLDPKKNYNEQLRGEINEWKATRMLVLEKQAELMPTRFIISILNLLMIESSFDPDVLNAKAMVIIQEFNNLKLSSDKPSVHNPDLETISKFSAETLSILEKIRTYISATGEVYTLGKPEGIYANYSVWSKFRDEAIAQFRENEKRILLELKFAKDLENEAVNRLRVKDNISEKVDRSTYIDLAKRTYSIAQVYEDIFPSYEEKLGRIDLERIKNSVANFLQVQLKYSRIDIMQDINNINNVIGKLDEKSIGAGEVLINKMKQKINWFSDLYKTAYPFLGVEIQTKNNFKVELMQWITESLYFKKLLSFNLSLEQRKEYLNTILLLMTRIYKYEDILKNKLNLTLSEIDVDYSVSGTKNQNIQEKIEKTEKVIDNYGNIKVNTGDSPYISGIIRFDDKSFSEQFKDTLLDLLKKPLNNSHEFYNWWQWDSKAGVYYKPLPILENTAYKYLAYYVPSKNNDVRIVCKVRKNLINSAFSVEGLPLCYLTPDHYSTFFEIDYGAGIRNFL